MMKEKEIMETIRGLGRTQGFYGKLYVNLKELQQEAPTTYRENMKKLEDEGFRTTLDLMLYFEEGRHCKKKYWKIPVTWEMYGWVEAEGDSIEEALENFRRDEDEYGLPEGEYVDGSFRLSDDDEENLKGLIALMNKENLEEGGEG